MSCSVRRYRTENGRRFLVRCPHAARFADAEGNSLCAGHHAQEYVEVPEPEPLWQRALRARAESGTRVPPGGTTGND